MANTDTSGDNLHISEQWNLLLWVDSY